MAAQQKYRDIKFFLVAIAFISAFNYYLTYSGIRFNWFLVLTYLNDTVQGWLAWWVVRSIIIYLDKKIPYGQRPLRRILVQLVLTTVAGMLVIIGLTEVTALVIRGRTAPISFYTFDLFIIVIWFFVINGIYIGMHYFAELRQSEQRRQEEKKIRIGGFAVKHGNQNLLIPFKEIVGFYVDDGNTILFTTEQKKHFTDRSLDRIELELPAEFFFRLNRQFILHRDTITGFKRNVNGKIDVLINATGSFPALIAVSRTKAVGFKSWFQPD